MEISTKKARKSGLFRFNAILATLLLVLLPSTGFSNFATAARAEITSEFSNDTSLRTFTVDGVAIVSENQVINIAQGRTSVPVAVETNEPNAVATVTGNTNLVGGNNTITVTVEADDGTIKIYTVTVVVAVPSSDKTLSSVKINDVAFTDYVSGTGVFNAPYGTTEVTVVALANSGAATVSVSGTTNLTSGSNTVTIHVVAENGTSTDYTFSVNVAAANTNTNLSTFKVNGSTTTSGSTIELPFGTSAVTVEADTEATTSTFSISGASGLSTGNNTLTVSVTAQSGATATYTVTLKVLAASSNKTISGITVNGETVADNAITLPIGTTTAAVLVTLDSAFASYTISGNDTVSAGTNTRTITVTAQDGSTADTTLTITVLAVDEDNSLGSITVDGSAVVANGTVNKPFGTTSVDVVATASSAKATVVVSGQTELESGNNVVNIAITSEAGVTATYSFTVVVAKSSNTNVTSIVVDNTNVTSSKTLTTGFGATSVTVAVVTEDANATYSVSGNTGLNGGANNVTITVTAADTTTTQNYVVVVTVPVASADATLKTLKVDNVAVTSGDTISKPNGTTSVAIIAETNDTNADVVVSGDTGLESGLNTVSIAVTAENGDVATYTLTINVAQSSNTNVTSIVVDNTNVTSSKALTTGFGATSVTVAVVTEDPNATFEVTGNTGLNGGANNVTITVTAADTTTTQNYVVVVTVPVASADATLKTLKVDNVAVTAGDTISKPNGTTSVVIAATPNSEQADVIVSGNTDLNPGLNTVNITVTAENGDVATYTLTINVAKSSNTAVTSILVDNNDVTLSKTYTTDFGATSVTVSAVTADADATYEVTGATDLEAGPNTVTVTVTAADTTTTQSYNLTVTVPVPSADATLKTLTVDGAAVSAGGSVSKPYGTTSVTVLATANSDQADVVVSGDTNLDSGANVVNIAVTAENGDVATYTVTVNIAASSDTSLASILANGQAVVVNGTLEVSAGTTSVLVVALANDPDATVDVSGNTALNPGNNEISILVTAADGTEETFTFTVKVQQLSSNVELSVFTINGLDVLGKATLSVGNSVDDALVIAQTDSPNATYAVITDTALAVGENTITVRVTAENGTQADYTVVVTRAEPLSSNTELTSITIGSTEVTVGGTYQAPAGTTEVTVDVVTADARSTAVVNGNTGLKVGTNTVNVVVTAENGDSEIFSFTVNVSKSNNTSLTDILVNGTSVGLVDPSATVASSASEASVVAIVADPEAGYLVTGPQTLAYGANEFVITVTAADGVTTAEYTVTVTRTPLSANTDLGTLTVNGTTIALEATFEVDPGITSVTVVATAADTDASATVSGNTNLIAGENTVTVTVTAADGTTTAEYTFIVFVKSLSNDTTLKTFTLDGGDVDGGDTKTLDGTKDYVTVIAVANDGNASVNIAGTTDLVFGSNDVTVTVTAEDGTVMVYTITVIYPNIRNVNVSSFTVNSDEVVNGQTVELEPYTTEVEIYVELEDPAATFEISGGTDLQPGENTLTLSITAVDGETTAEINVILMVALGNNIELATFQINGENFSDGDTLELDPYTTEVEVTAEAVDPDATVVIAGETELSAGESDLTVTVTAPDGTVMVYTVLLIVAEGNNVELATFQVNGNDVADGDITDIEPYSTEVEVTIETVDPEATYEIMGDTDLVQGENTLTVYVTAANGIDIADYTVTLNVLLGNDVTVTEITIDGNVVADGDSLDVENGTTEVAVLATTTDPLATYAVTGGTNLITGENAVVVTVTAQDGTTAEYTITVVVLPSSDTSLSALSVDGVDVVDGETLDLAYGTTEVQVIATATDADATVEVSGTTDLAPGENLLVISVTAADGETVFEYTITLMVALNSDTSLATFQVNGTDVQDGEVIDLPPYTTDAEITAEATDGDATVEIEGGSELVSGENQVAITVTAANGYDSYTYTLTLVVALGNDVTLTSWTVNGDDAADGETLVLAPRTEVLEVLVETTDPDATYAVAGADVLEVGENVVTVTVTAADQSTSVTYTVTLILRSSDVSLAEFTVNGSPVEDGDYFELPIGTTDTEVAVVTSDELATFEIEGGTGLEAGENTLTVTVTAADEETQGVYTVTLFVLLNNDTSLATFTVNGDPVEDGTDIELPPYTDAVDVVAEATDGDANVDIAGADGLVAGANELVVTVTAADGETVQVYVVSIFVEISTETGLSELSVNGETAIDGDVILSTDLELTEVDVSVTAIDENAVVDIVGGTDLVLGDNLITITVTAPSGDVRVYTVTFRLGGLPGNAKLKSLNVGGTSISLTATEPSVTLAAGSKSVAVIAAPEDEAATVAITGNKLLVTGANTVTVRVTATDGKTVRDYVVTVNVPALSSNSNISSLKVNNATATAGSTINLPAGTRFAEILAVPEDSSSSVLYTGNKDLVAGPNTVTVKVTAANGTFTEYTLTLTVETLSNDKSLKSFSIEGFNVLGKGKLTVASGTRKLRVSAQANNSGASVSISGRDILPGSNNVVVTVTAADGTSTTYTVIVKVKA